MFEYSLYLHILLKYSCHNMRSHIVHPFCGRHNLKLWLPHIDTACLADIGKQTHIDTFCGTYNFKLWPPHIETTFVSHIEKQSLYVATHPILVLYECYYMWPHIETFSANYLPLRRDISEFQKEDENHVTSIFVHE